MSPARHTPAATVLRRALLLWGAGHISLGDRRGWLLLPLQPLFVAGVAGLVILLVDSTRWILVFPVLAGLIVFWLGQAIHAHQLALKVGAAPGGELQLAWTLPLILAAVTAFWLIGGNHATPASTLQEYVSDWRAGRAESAALMFVERIDAETLAAEWRVQREYIRQRVTEAAALYGSTSGLDPDDPFSGLRFLELTDSRSAQGTTVAVDIVRRQRVEATLFGLIPTAIQETIRVERAGLIRLVSVPAELPGWLPSWQPPPAVWRIQEVILPADPGVALAHHSF